MKIPEVDWGYSYNHPKAVHKHTNKFKSEPFNGYAVPVGDDPDQGEYLFHTNPGEAMEHSWTVPAGVESIFAFGAGGGISVLSTTFGMFTIPVSPGDTLSIVVGDVGDVSTGGLPDGGDPGYLVESSDGSPNGGGGSTSLWNGASCLFVAPGAGGLVSGPGSGNSVASWQHWNPSPAAWIGASMANPSPDVPNPEPGEAVIDFSLGDQGAGMNGGDGEDWVLSGEPAKQGGDDGGGWGGGPGGAVYKVKDLSNEYVFFRCRGGLSGRPYVVGGSSYAGEPFTERVDGSPFYPPFSSYSFGCGYLYIRWFNP